MKMKDTEWFEDWFDTSYYHILYKNRDFSEAEEFIHRLALELNLEPQSAVLDLACGRGRHALTLSNCGFKVLGVDLSENSIQAAKQFENDVLEFAVHDMRNVIPDKQFDAVFNLFTSFGYFDSLKDNQRVMNSIAQMLKPNGIFVIDFMNAPRVIENLVVSESKEVDNIHFTIQRRFDGHHIFKEIKFVADSKLHSYTERVQALKVSDFRFLLESANFEILSSFGNFNLEAFDESTSDRLIIIAQLKSWD